MESDKAERGLSMSDYDETVHYPDDYVFWPNGGAIRHEIWHRVADLARQLNQLQAYDRGIKPIIAHADWKPLPDFCTNCNSYAFAGDLCDACSYCHSVYSMWSGVFERLDSQVESSSARKQKPKRAPKLRLRYIIFDFLNDLAIYINERLS